MLFKLDFEPVDEECEVIDLYCGKYPRRGRKSQPDWRTENANDLQTARQMTESPDTDLASTNLAGLVRRNGYNILRDALQEGLTNVAKAMLRHGARVNNVSGKAGDSPLHIAVLRGDVEMCELLISMGAKTYAMNKDQDTPLFVAVRNKNVDVIKVLLQNRIDVHDKNKHGQTPLECILLPRFRKPLLDAKTSEIAKLLLSFGADVNKTATQETMLQVSIDRGRDEIVKLLLELNADVNMCGLSGISPLMKAVERDDINLMLQLLNSGAQVNSKSGKGNFTPLHTAVRRGRENLIDVLLSRPEIEVNSKAGNGETPLHVAAQKGKGSTIKALLEKGATINVQDGSGKSVLHHAVEVEYLYGRGESEHVNQKTPLDILLNNADINLKDNDGRTAVLLENRSANIVPSLNHKADINLQDNAGKTPLHLAVSSKRSIENSTFYTLLQHGAKTNLKDNTGKTPLHVALVTLKDKSISYPGKAVVDLIVDHGAEVNSEDDDGKTPLHYAAEHSVFSRESALSGLFDHGADINVVDNEGQSALHIAGRFSDENILELLKKGAEKDVQDVKGKTPFHFAIESRYESNALLLANQGVRVDIKDFEGKTSLHYAAKADLASILKLLLARGVEVNAKDAEGKTPLHVAAEHSSECNILALINHGADINVQDNSGQTPLHYAVKREQPSLVSVLLNRGAYVNSKDIEGKTPLYVLATYTATRETSDIVDRVRSAMTKEVAIGRSVIATVLLQHGAFVDCKDEFGNTALHMVAQRGSATMVRALLKYGADVNARTYVYPNNTPLKCSKQPATRTLENHIVKLAAMNFPVGEIDFDFNTLRLQELQFQCEDEIKHSKEVKVANGDKTISLYDILTKNKWKLSSFLKNGISEDVSRMVRFELTDFPIYRSMIDDHFRLAVERVSLINEITVILGDLFAIPPGICVDAITDYLTNGDIKSLITACS